MASPDDSEPQDTDVEEEKKQQQDASQENIIEEQQQETVPEGDPKMWYNNTKPHQHEVGNLYHWRKYSYLINDVSSKNMSVFEIDGGSVKLKHIPRNKNLGKPIFTKHKFSEKGGINVPNSWSVHFFPPWTEKSALSVEESKKQHLKCLMWHLSPFGALSINLDDWDLDLSKSFKTQRTLAIIAIIINIISLLAQIAFSLWHLFTKDGLPFFGALQWFGYILMIVSFIIASANLFQKSHWTLIQGCIMLLAFLVFLEKEEDEETASAVIEAIINGLALLLWFVTLK